jgi:hypothetical protein
MGLTNSRTGAARVTLEEKKRRDREIALEDGRFTSRLLVLSWLLTCVHAAEYARAQWREVEELELEREWAHQVRIWDTLNSCISISTRTCGWW